MEEAYFGDLEKNKHEWKKANLGREQVGKAAVVGMKNRTTGQIKAQVVERTDEATPGGFADDTAKGAQLYTDSAITPTLST